MTGVGALSASYFSHALPPGSILAILRGHGVDRTLALAESVWAAGVNLVEIPLQDSRSLVALRETVELGKTLGKEVGAGTIVSTELVARAREAGAAFTVAPGLDPLVVAASGEHGLPHLPGVFTPSDIQAAMSSGFSWMKLFPASVLTPAGLRQLRGPFPDVSFVATGGVEVASAEEYFRAGARAVGIGGAVESITAADVVELGMGVPR
ncbi:bifunctional 4-hydroxy-2-oxoglutarate aldolase/2-dehydro-3-deoxy-phosphogluconate aldolase [Salinibacterium sp. G-O1]|uniref:bifunctional 4-hydroxy-2-oxoglutarate aldolase/2-dehydro-3-deoxy-phosphogluconate aldolase n=1 Tax=Salinibacterium sp. G-O1 TaxID=3046208 RepID=UPI0024BBA2C2|nr:bifunctional 4-hydroxy-2-oxoglutarate aldolase/2-dehydro-3-deoxy-phosphogluconate aldolase [Salinibacterium sp. G-O1]MDJ0334925.1 bifunctional 4-hydroxy-2-oxoglutarate aldolase/2-dehydro-3-deoxy-phosphogluconate aldolase [Salinibacterium sp. G-O1]